LVSIFLAAVVSILLLESWVSEEGSDECGIIAFHNDGCRNDDGPEDRFAIGLDTLPDGCVVFNGGGKSCFVVQHFPAHVECVFVMVDMRRFLDGCVWHCSHWLWGIVCHGR